jgi:hypothetical protein
MPGTDAGIDRVGETLRRECRGPGKGISHKICSPSENHQAGFGKKFGSGNGANAREKSCYNIVFWQNIRYPSNKTVLFIRVRICAKILRTALGFRNPGLSGARYGRNFNPDHGGSGMTVSDF